MKLIKLNPDHYVVVDDSPKTKDFCIPIGTKYLDDTYAIREAVTEDIDYWASRKDYYIITHSTRPFGGSATAISLHEVKELIGEVDVEKKAESYAKDGLVLDTPYANGLFYGYIKGYTQAIEDNKEKKYTEDDLAEAILRTIDACNKAQKDSYGELEIDEEAIIQSLQPKTQWEVEIVGGKLKLL